MKNDLEGVIAQLKRRGTKAGRDGMARYAIPSDKAFGVSVGTLRQMAKRIGHDHELAAALWKSGWYEARMPATMVDDPERVSSAQMDRWCVALMWGLTVHDKNSGDASFLEGLTLIERAAGDDRNFVKKAVNMALRAVGKRNPALNAAAVAVARRLAASEQPAARWNGKDALRELTGPSVARRLAAKRKAKGLAHGA